jgi:hypothetical protein
MMYGCHSAKVVLYSMQMADGIAVSVIIADAL